MIESIPEFKLCIGNDIANNYMGEPTGPNFKSFKEVIDAEVQNKNETNYLPLYKDIIKNAKQWCKI